ncbi:MAG: hypothetical protein M1830_010376, partial [Pleopsidium flavum]
MAPQSRGKKANRGSFSHSLSTPNLPFLHSFQTSSPASPEQRTPTSNVPNGHDNDHILPNSPSDHDDLDEDDDADFQSHYPLDARSYSSSTSSTDSEATPINPTNTTTTTNINNNQPERRPLLNHSTSSLPSANAFAPPFYNRPPTPLPPSPSLTSLLRPPFSTTTSRPTTPDSSDIETPNDTEAA